MASKSVDYEVCDEHKPFPWYDAEEGATSMANDEDVAVNRRFRRFPCQVISIVM
jgi:hypothetical protein